MFDASISKTNKDTSKYVKVMTNANGLSKCLLMMVPSMMFKIMMVLNMMVHHDD